MKYTINIDRERDEEVVIFAHERNELIERIEAILQDAPGELLGYGEGEIVRIEPARVDCFTVEDGRVYAVTDGGRYQLKLRLYQVEACLGSGFVKINQSCIVNVSRIKSFKTSLGGSLMVTLKGGYRDYVSRRQLKTVKERIGL
ncbi:MAG: LytTR family transcriptional regulator [Clostridia bacterium]|nr:LytTR family transcriptional regulator [Clostridia bacterium]